MAQFEVTRILPYPAEQLFDLAADVERYPEFLQWWHAANVRRRDGETYYTDQVVGIGPIRQRFATKTVLIRPTEIAVTSIDSAFDAFDLTWRFAPRPDGQCTVSLSGDVAVRAPLLSRLLSRTLADGAGGIMAAFEKRAQSVLG